MHQSSLGFAPAAPAQSVLCAGLIATLHHGIHTGIKLVLFSSITAGLVLEIDLDEVGKSGTNSFYIFRNFYSHFHACSMLSPVISLKVFSLLFNFSLGL